MNDLISVNNGLSNISTDFTALFAEFDALEQSTIDVGSLVGDTSLWQAESRDKCEELHELIMKYFTEIRPMYQSLKTAILELDCSVDEFASISRNVGKLW